MKYSLLAACIVIVFFTSCELSKDHLKEKTKTGLINYFHQKHKDALIDSLKILRVKKLHNGCYQAVYEVKQADSVMPGILVSIDNITDKAILTRDFLVVE